MKTISVESFHLCKSPPEWRSRAGVIQTIFDIVKAHGGELRVETLPAEAAAQAGKVREVSIVCYFP